VNKIAGVVSEWYWRVPAERSGAPLESLPEAPGVNPPEVVEAAVDEDDGHLIGVGGEEARVVGSVDVDGGEARPDGGADVADDGDGVVTQMAARAREDADARVVQRGHKP
jgi:hypothetical protein